MRLRLLVLVAALVLLVLGLLFAFSAFSTNSGASSADAAQVVVAPSVFVAPGGSDAAACTKAAPCLTFQRAFQVAAAGATVEMAGGSYGAQDFDTASKTGAPILFQPAAGATVTIADLDITRAANLEIRDFADRGVTYLRQGAQNVTLRNYTADLLFIRGADGILLANGSYGPNDAGDYMNWITEPYQSSDPAQDVTLDGVTFHDFTKHNAGSHVDCLGIGNSDRLTIRNSRFYTCAHFAIIPGRDPSGGYARHLTIENNFIQCCDPSGGGFYSIGLGDVSDATIRFNSISGQGIGFLGGADIRTVIDSNVIDHNNAANCGSATWTYNVVGDNACGGSNRVGASSFAGPPTDLHLRAGAAALGFGNPSSFPATDIDGQARVSPPDAGADQSGSNPPPTTTTVATTTTTTPTTTTVPPPCGRPTLSTSAPSRSSITVNWEAVAGATSYRLFKNGTQTSTAGASATSAKFGSLPYGDTVLGVTAVCPSGTGASSLTTYEQRLAR